MGNEASTGKSRLGRIFESMFNLDLPYYYYSYSHFKNGIKLESILSSKEFNVVLIDRADLYIQDYNFMEEILPYSNKTIFLVDLKNIPGFFRYTKSCEVCPSELEIEVN